MSEIAVTPRWGASEGAGFPAAEPTPVAPIPVGQPLAQVGTVAAGESPPGCCGIRAAGVSVLPVGLRLVVLGSPGKTKLTGAMGQKLHSLATLPLKVLAELEVVKAGDGWAHARILNGTAPVDARVYLMREDD